LASWGGATEANRPNLIDPDTVNVDDFAMLAGNWQTSNVNITGDTDSSGKIDVNDIEIPSDYWLQECY
jgi:hypothetical protein